MPVKKTNRQKIVDFYRGNEEFVKRMLDLKDQAERRQIPMVTPFLTSAQQNIVNQLLHHQCVIERWGGYEEAESCRMLVAPRWWDGIRDFEITLLKGQYVEKYCQLTHRDVLGALMNLGAAREVIGDIVVENGVIYVFCTDAIAPYLIQTLTRINRTNVTFSRCHERIERTLSITWNSAVISSMRLDTVVAAITRLSRYKAQELIKGGMVKLDHVILEETASLCNNECTVSVRGFGRFLVHNTMRRTQKNNLVVEIGKYC